jgi:hypothetical protein
MSTRILNRVLNFSFPSEPVLIDTTLYDLTKEIDRLSSFLDNNWRNEYVNAVDLALVGFYYYQTYDVVMCYFCGVIIKEFEEGDMALGEHKKWSGNCPLLKRRPIYNVPINEEILDQILPPLSYDECGFSMRRPVTGDEIRHSNFKLLIQRLTSFKTWPVGIKQRPQELSEAGFFYNGQSDVTICFACGLRVGNWEPTDNCWDEHKKNETCPFVKLNHDSVTQNNKNCDGLMKLPKVGEINTEIQYESFCKICMEKKPSIIFMPCRHVAVCGQCAFGIEKDCPICRTTIIEKLNLFYC